MRRTFLILTLMLGIAPQRVHAQAPSSSLRPIDPVVEDIDPLQRSLRRLEPGIGSPGVDSDSHIFQDNAPGGDRAKFYYIRPGVIAQYNRSDYITVERRKRLVTYQLVGPNTVYMLGGIPRPVAPAHDQPLSPQLIQARLSARLEDAAPAAGDENDSGPTLAQQWQAYHRFRDSQRRRIFGALDRAAASQSKTAAPASPPQPVKP